jgi:hypothetical protein
VLCRPTLSALAVVFGCACSPFLDDGGLSGGGTPLPEGGTTLPSAPLVDCKVPAFSGELRCRSIDALTPGSVGAGPAIDYSGVPLQEVMGGAIDGQTLFLAIQNYHPSGLGGVVAVDLVTGERTLVAGALRTIDGGTLSQGEGYGFHNLQNLVVAAGGPISAFTWDGMGFDAWILEIDRVTGNRTAQPVGDTCYQTLPANLLPQSFVHAALGSDTAAYVLGDSTAGQALVKLLGGQCDVLLTLDFGQVGFNPHALNLEAGAIWATNQAGDELSSIDAYSGQAALVSGPSSLSPTESIPLGRSAVAVDATRAWTVGGESDFRLTEVERATGARKSHPNGAGPIQAKPLTAQNVWVHPTYAALLLELDGAIIVYDPATGISNTLSY